ncbi:MAG: protein phosphatase 2C domain-containing protein [Bacteroidales bacterium]|nr:protein phosphatase 2C domain-containing protein [Bacteroidales bacterium]
MWKLVHAESKGRSHEKLGTPCQDKTFVISRNGVSVLALADGAGSASLSHIGAEGVVKCIGETLCDSFDLFWNSEAEFVRSNIFEIFTSELHQLAKDNNCGLDDLSSTLLAVAVKDKRYLIFHLGDGVIGFWTEEGVSVASYPTNGEFANTTIFTTSKDAKYSIRLFKGLISDRNIDGFIIFSDGVESGLFDFSKKRIIPAVGRIFMDLQESSTEEVQQNLISSLEVIKTKTTDDCSIAIMVNCHDAFNEDACQVIKHEQAADQSKAAISIKEGRENEQQLTSTKSDIDLAEENQTIDAPQNSVWINKGDNHKPAYGNSLNNSDVHDPEIIPKNDSTINKDLSVSPIRMDEVHDSNRKIVFLVVVAFLIIGICIFTIFMK